MAKKRKSQRNPYQKKEPQSLFSFDPMRRALFRQGIVAGAAGGFFMIFEQVIWQIIGALIVVVIANYYISRAARHMPRLHATVFGFAGVALGMFGMIIIGTIVITYYRTGLS